MFEQTQLSLLLLESEAQDEREETLLVAFRAATPEVQDMMYAYVVQLAALHLREC